MRREIDMVCEIVVSKQGEELSCLRVGRFIAGNIEVSCDSKVGTSASKGKKG